MSGRGAMTKTGSRFGLTSLVVVCLVAAAGVAAMRGTWENPAARTAAAGGDELVSFVVTFEPAKRDNAVTITLTAGGRPETYVRKDSPFVHEAMVAPGTPVSLGAVQVDGGLLTCKIRKGLKKLAEQDNLKPEGRAVICKATT